MGVEVLIPDFNGAEAPLRTVMGRGPDILNHNLETVRRLQKPVRKRARWDRTLGVLERAKAYAAEYAKDVHTKSSLMVGLGETRDELTEAFEALREVDADILTIGQYLRPTLDHLPLERYYHPDEFASMKEEALALGFKHVESGPLVRSSYHARDQVPGAELRNLRRRATIDAEGRIVPGADAGRGHGKTRLVAVTGAFIRRVCPAGGPAGPGCLRLAADHLHERLRRAGRSGPR